MQAGHETSYDTLEKGVWGVWSQPCLVAASSDCEWTQQMSSLMANNALIVAPPPRPPAVDWSRQTVVLVALGRADGYAVEVRGVSHVGHRLLLDVHVEMGSRTGEVDYSPYHLLAADANSVDEVVARYDLAPPGLPTTVSLTGCGVAPSVKANRPAAGAVANDGASSAAPTVAATSWGALKIRYR